MEQRRQRWQTRRRRDLPGVAGRRHRPASHDHQARARGRRGRLRRGAAAGCRRRPTSLFAAADGTGADRPARPRDPDRPVAGRQGAARRPRSGGLGRPGHRRVVRRARTLPTGPRCWSGFPTPATACQACSRCSRLQGSPRFRQRRAGHDRGLRRLRERGPEARSRPGRPAPAAAARRSRPHRPRPARPRDPAAVRGRPRPHRARLTHGRARDPAAPHAVHRSARRHDPGDPPDHLRPAAPPRDGRAGPGAGDRARRDGSPRLRSRPALRGSRSMR